METLLIQLDPGDQSAHWLVLDDAGRPHAGIRQGPVSQLKDFSRQRRVVCTLDSTEVFLDHVHLPAGRNRRKLQQAVPFALEDELAEDVDALHFAIGKEQTITPDTEDEQTAIKQVDVPVVVVGKNTIEQRLQILHDAGIKPHVLIPDVLSLPFTENEWTVLLTHDHALVRTGIDTGFACDPQNLALLLDSALDDLDPPPQQIRVWRHNNTEAQIELQNTDIELTVTETDQLPLNTLARGYGGQPPVNLLQGEYSYRQEYGKLLKPWRLPAALTGALLLALLIYAVIDYTRLKHESTHLQAQIVQVYKEVFPRSINTTAPRHQLETKLAKLGAGGGGGNPMLKLLSSAAAEIGQQKAVSIRSIQYDGKNLDISISAGNVQQVDKLKQKLVDHGINTEIQSASAEGDKVKGQLRITAQ